LGIEKKEQVFERANVFYSAFMFKSLAYRLAEAFAEALHARVRKDIWGYVPDESLTNAQMIKEAYQGIRPAPGYPACPEHVVKREMFEVLDGADIGMMLTESYAMHPAASV
jgi:5-methyltetrahydrofolate--homocysteine methyltransferase